MLRSRSPIHNLQGTIHPAVPNRTNRRRGALALRRFVTALIVAEQKVRRVKGHREIFRLVAALEVLVNNNVLETKEKLAEETGRNRCSLST